MSAFSSVPSLFLLLFGTALALLYGAIFVMRPISVPRSLIKTGATAALAVSSLADPWLLLSAALCAGALGDWLLSRETGFLAGLISFAVGHGIYVALFLPLAGPPPVLGLVMLVGIAGALLLWLWPNLGEMRGPVVFYAALSVVLASIALGMPFGLAVMGILAFVLSDIILGAVLFGLAESHKLQPILQRLLWTLYWGGQVMIFFGAKTLL